MNVNNSSHEAAHSVTLLLFKHRGCALLFVGFFLNKMVDELTENSNVVEAVDLPQVSEWTRYL